VVGDDLYYSSNRTGIFNIYKRDINTEEDIQISNVIGGAFYPSVNANGDVVYSNYTSTGYKIFLLTNQDQKQVNPEKQYTWIDDPPINFNKPNGDINNFEINNLTNYNDREVPDFTPVEYSGTFSKIMLVPFLRFDNYNISDSFLDRIKPGVILSSFDYLNRYSIFGGGAINKRFERDLFLILEYKNKIPILFDLGLTPELGLEFYSVSRKTNVDVLFGIDSTGSVPIPDYIVNTEVSYDLFEFDFIVRNHIFDRSNELELRFIYSSYTSVLSSFVLPDLNSTLYPTTKDNYFIGRNFQAKLEHEMFLPYIDSDINPVGRKVGIQYNYEFNKFNPESNYEIKDGALVPLYDNFNFHRLELNWEESIPILPSHTINARLRAGSIFGPTMPDFFDFYLGGLVGMKSYPFYAVNGNELAWLNFSYRFPLFRNIDSRIGHLYLDKIFLSIYGEIGNAWNGDIPSINEFKKGAGAELRIKMTSFYLFPTSVFINAAYSFDQFSRIIRNENITYGKEWQFYGGILFDFNLF